MPRINTAPEAARAAKRIFSGEKVHKRNSATTQHSKMGRMRFRRVRFLRVAVLQNEVSRKIFFEARFFSRKISSEIFPEMFEPLFFVGQKIPQNSRQISGKISLPEIKKKSPTSFCRGAGRTVSNTELSEFFDPHRVLRRELSEFLVAF